MSATTPTARVGLDFPLPREREAPAPPEHRGVDRDGVRLLVARPDGVSHATFRDLPVFLDAGDLVVVNTSAMLPAALDGVRADGRPVVVHLARPLDGGAWAVELRRSDGAGPTLDGLPGEEIRLPGGVEMTLGSAYPPGAKQPSRLWDARLLLEGSVERYLDRHGRPITYGYLREPVGLEGYTTVFGRHPGSAEMASAGRPFTDAMVTELVTRGVLLAPVLLHAGVSSPEADEPPLPERFAVPAATAAVVEHVRRGGGRVIAMGTTVARALESAVDRAGRVRAAAGETNLVLGPHRRARVVDGLVTGWHAPGASHLLLLEAVAGRRLVEDAYRAALAQGYLWHEFGDSCLFLPSRRRRAG